ncbi:MAG: peptidylprolyl isomerase [Opitutales bacterium]
MKAFLRSARFLPGLPGGGALSWGVAVLLAVCLAVGARANVGPPNNEGPGEGGGAWEEDAQAPPGNEETGDGPAFTPTEDGLYAVLDVTIGETADGETNVNGEIAVRLLHEQAPMTVANFVGLAEGTQPWLDLQQPNPEVRESTRYFDGTVFHRVIDGFVIQGGSPNGTGTGGPGYEFVDEIVPGLVHDAAGYLSMANSGEDTNGSQFFITLAPTANLNAKHSIFGQIVETADDLYLDFIQRIGDVATDDNDHPVQPVTLNRVTILREGVVFDAAAWQLPRVSEPVGFDMFVNDSGSLIQRITEIGTENYNFLFSEDLENWLGLFHRYGGGQSGPFNLNLDGFPTAAPRFIQVWELENGAVDQTGAELTLQITDTASLNLSFSEPGMAESLFDDGDPETELRDPIPFSPYRWLPIEGEDLVRFETSNMPLLTGSVSVPRAVIYLDFATSTYRATFLSFQDQLGRVTPAFADGDFSYTPAP